MDEVTLTTPPQVETPAEAVQPPETVSTETPPPEDPAPQEDYAWLKELPSDVVDAMKTGGPNWAKQVNRRNQELVEARKEYEKLLTEAKAKNTPPKPEVPQKAETSTLKALLQRKVDAGELAADYANQLYAEAEAEINKPSIKDELNRLLDERLEEVQKFQSIQKAQEELIEITNGLLDSDQAFAFVNGFTSLGKTPTEALQEVKKILAGVQASSVKKEVKEIMSPPKTKIVTPGTGTPSGSVASDDIVAKVKAMTLADAQKGI